MSAGGSTTNTTRNQSLCPQVSLSTSSSSSHEIVEDTEQLVNKMASQNQITHMETLRTQLEKMTTHLQNLAQLKETLKESQTQYAPPISLQRVSKGKDMQVPPMKKTSLDNYI